MCLVNIKQLLKLWIGVLGKQTYWPVVVAQPTELSSFGIATMDSVSIQ